MFRLSAGMAALRGTAFRNGCHARHRCILARRLNLIGNLPGITTPIIIGVIVEHTGTFHYALLYVAGTAMLAIVAYLPIVGEIRRLHCRRDRIAGSNR